MPVTSSGGAEVTRSSRPGLILLSGVALLGMALAVHGILLETVVWTVVLVGAGVLLSAWGAFALLTELGEVMRRRRGEIALYTLGVIGVLIAMAYLSVLYPLRFDVTEARLYSLSSPTVTMLKRLDKPVHIVFFHDPMMRETVELYELIARQTRLVTVEFYDPMLKPAQARMLGVQFAGTAVMESEGRKLQVSGDSETDIANGILRVSRDATQLVCFLAGHGEADPFNLESHDHMEGAPGHTHGLGAKYVLHERHGIGKARHGLENLNYKVEKVALLQGGDPLSRCAVLVVAGPKVALLSMEVGAVRAYLSKGGNAFFMLDPFVRTELEPVIREYGVVLDDDIVIDEASHFWADVSAPAVSDYNRHQVTRDLPLTFFPGVRSLSPTPERVPGTSVTPIVNSSKNSWGQTNRNRVEFNKDHDVPGPNTLMVLALRRPVTPDSATAISFGPQESRSGVAKRGTKAAPAVVAGRSRPLHVGARRRCRPADAAPRAGGPARRDRGRERRDALSLRARRGRRLVLSRRPHGIGGRPRAQRRPGHGGARRARVCGVRPDADRATIRLQDAHGGLRSHHARDTHPGLSAERYATARPVRGRRHRAGYGEPVCAGRRKFYRGHHSQLSDRQFAGIDSDRRGHIRSGTGGPKRSRASRTPMIARWALAAGVALVAAGAAMSPAFPHSGGSTGFASIAIGRESIRYSLTLWPYRM